MSDQIPVNDLMVEKTYVGKVKFPSAIPNSLVEWVHFPDDLVRHADEMGLDHHSVQFILGALRGKWSVTAGLDLPDLSPKLGMSFDEIDRIVRGLVEKNYARMNDRLDLYRLWIVLLHVKGIEFVLE